MTRDDILRRLEPWLARHRRPAWTPVTEGGDGPPTGSKFCGVPWTGPGADWPTCRGCGKPLAHFLQLDLGDLPGELGGRFGTGLLQLFYCTRGDCQGEGGWEPFDGYSCARVVRPAGPLTAIDPPEQEDEFPAQRIVGWVRHDDLPSPAELDDLGLTLDYDFDAATLRLACPDAGLDVTYPMDDLPAEDITSARPVDKLGGWPMWVQGVEYPNCPRCGARMRLVVQVDSEDHVPFMFGDVGCGHVTQCPDHPDEVAFGWACS